MACSHFYSRCECNAKSRHIRTLSHICPFAGILLTIKMSTNPSSLPHCFSLDFVILRLSSSCVIFIHSLLVQSTLAPSLVSPASPSESLHDESQELQLRPFHDDDDDDVEDDRIQEVLQTSIVYTGTVLPTLHPDMQDNLPILPSARYTLCKNPGERLSKQGRIHGYPSRMRVGRSIAGEGHQGICAGAVCSKSTKTPKK